MSTLQSLLAILSGSVVGLSLGLLGGGGSILAVPLLLYVVKLPDPHVVIGTSAFAVAFNAYVNLIPHARAGHVRWRSAIIFALPGVLGAFIGSYFGSHTQGQQLLFLFAVLMMVIAGFMLRGDRRKSAFKPQALAQNTATMQTEAVPHPVDSRAQPRIHRIVPAGFLVGGLSGFFGIGGGFLIVPGLIVSTNMSMIEAIGSSLFAVGTFGLTTAATYTAAGLINWLALAEYTAGGIVGGFLGARLATRLSHSRDALNHIFSAVIFVVALYMIYKNIQAIP